MFTQGQILGMESSLLSRLKTEITSWDNTAERHPYSVYRKGEPRAPREEKFTTSFGNELPLRVHDRNGRARRAAQSTATMKQPFPSGYTGHVPNARASFALTYGKQTRTAINGATPDHSNLSSSYCSTSQASYTSPDAQVAAAAKAAADSVLTREQKRASSTKGNRYESTLTEAYRAPGAQAYLPPAWTEQVYGNCGQPDPYGHFRRSAIHTPSLTKPADAVAPSASTVAPSARSDSALSAANPAAPTAMGPKAGEVPAAGRATRFDAWVARGI